MRSRAAIASPNDRARSAMRGESGSADGPMTPTLIFIAASDLKPLRLELRHNVFNLYRRDRSLFSVPPLLRQEPRNSRQQKEGADAGGHPARRDSKSVHQLADDVIRGRHRQSHQSHLSVEDAPAKIVFNGFPLQHSRKD